MKKLIIITSVYLCFPACQFLLAQSPGNVSTNLQLWLRADSGTGATIHGEVLTGWADQSGNSHDMTAAGDPTLNLTTGANFNPTIDFDGVGDIFTRANIISGTTGRTVFIVNSQDDTESDLLRLGEGGCGRRWKIANRATTGVTLAINCVNQLWANAQTGFRITSLSHDSDAKAGRSATDVRVFYDGALAASTGGVGGMLTINTGNAATEVGRNLVGSYSELIVYDTELTRTQRERVHTYLAIKYGITLPHDYVNSAGTVIWDTDGANATYSHDIAGIGRENTAENLVQDRSKSENSDAIITISAPTSLDEGDYLIWGNDDATGTRPDDLPSGFDQRLQRVWFFEETGDVGLVTMRFDLSSLGNLSDNPDDYAILLSTTNSFSTATIETNGASISGNVLTFTNVSIEDGNFMTLAVSAIRGPGAVSNNLLMWHSADKVDLDPDGQTIDSWKDQSGQGNNAVPIPFERPLLEPTSTLNGNPFVNYTADNGGQVSLTSLSSKSTFLAVLRSSTNNTDIFELDNNANPQLEIEAGRYRGNANGGFVSTASTGKWNIVGLLNAGVTEHHLYVDGHSQATDASSISIPASADYNLFTNFTGEVAEVIYFEDALTDTERRQVESYLAIKYGITLDISSQDYLNGAGTSILDMTDFAGYVNNIAGIGRANASAGTDAQGFIQTQSQSNNTSAIVSVGNASNLNDGEYLLWGSNNAMAPGSLTESVPAPAIPGVQLVLDRKWRITETGETGTIDISFDLSSVSAVSGRELARYTLVLDDTEDMSSPVTSIKPTTLNSDVVTFSGVDLNEGYFMVLGTDVGAAPGDVVSNLSLWFKAGAGITTSGSNVTGWVDQSPTALDLDDQNGNPTLGTNAINSNDAVTFDGNDNIHNSGTYDTENLLSGGTLTGQHTFYVVAQHSLTNPSSRNVFFSNGSDQFRQGLVTSPHVHIQESSSTNNDISPGSINIDRPNIYVIKRTANNTSGGGTLYINSSTIANYNTGNGVTDDTKIVIGGENDADGNNSWVGNIAEVIAFATSEDDTDRQKIETYLAVKYGITLTNNYLSTGGGTVYNVSNGYAHDIAGLGREDNELLAQVQSKSENSDAIISMSNAQSLDDGEYLIWGNNDGATSETATGLPSGVNQMLTRKWYIAETGDLKGVQIQFDLTGLTITGSTVTDFSLIVDGDATFNDGDEVLFTADDFSSNVVTFNSVDLANGAIISLATSVSSNLTEISSAVGDYEVTTGCPVLTGNSYIDIRDSNDRLVFSINPNGNNLGATCWGVRIRASGSSSDDLVNKEDYYLDRNFYITPTTQPSSDVSLRFYVLNEEIDDIRNRLTADGKSSGNDVAEYLQDFFRVTKQEGSDLDPLTRDAVGAVIIPAVSVYETSGYIAELNVDSFSEFLPGTNAVDPNLSLPIDLLYFEAQSSLDGVSLTWATASEENNDYFLVERSADGIRFEGIKKIAGAGNSTETLYYDAIDTKPMAGLSYYRLKQTDYDGKYTYSPMESVSTSLNGSIVHVFPNPTSKVITIKPQIETNEGKVTVRLMHVTGTVIGQYDHLGDISIEANFDSGIYLLEVRINEHIQRERVIIR